MSFMRRLSRRAPPSGLILPREVAARGVANWPKCALCMRGVDAYGLENETDSMIEIWARCDGVAIDPSTGVQIHGSPRVHEVKKSSVFIKKGPGWSGNRLTDIISRLAFFAPGAASEGREFTQNLSADGLKKRDTV